MVTVNKSQAWWDEGAAAIQSRANSQPSSTTRVVTVQPTGTTKPNSSTGVNSGTQFVERRDGTVNYDDIPFERYAGSMGNAFSLTTDAQRQMIDQIGNWRLKDPNTQAAAYATRRTADAAYKQAEAAYAQAQNGNGDNRSALDYNRDFRRAANERAADEREARRQWLREQQAAGWERQYQAGQNNANRDLDRYLAGLRKETELGVAKLNKEGMMGVARINQPLSADQMLERSRIENPDPMKGMAANLLGSYSSGQGARSNFAYWG